MLHYENKQEGKRGSLFQAAAYCYHKEIVRLLLDKGAEAEAFQTEYRSALETESSRGHDAIVQLLLENGRP